MLKNILNLKGAQQLNKDEQNGIKGGYNYIKCFSHIQCPTDWFCNGKHCVPCIYNTDPTILVCD